MALRVRREHGVQLRMIHWISEEKLLKLKRIFEKKNKTRKGEVFIAKIGRVKV